jgi:hypothetical protein
MLNVIPPQDCKIEYLQDGRQTTLSGMIYGQKTRAGTYQFRITTSSDMGRSSNIQAGEFLALAGSTRLSVVTINGKISELSAELRVFDSEGRLACSSSMPI